MTAPSTTTPTSFVEHIFFPFERQQGGMSLRDASDRSQTLVDSLRATFQQINKLSKEPNPELAQDIHETLKHNETTLELLQQDAEDFAAISDRTHNRDTDRARESARLSAQVARLAEDLKQ